MWEIAGLLAVAAAAAIWRSEYEKKKLSVWETEVSSPKLQKNRTFVFLSDLHDNEFGRENEKLLEAIEKFRPDAVLIGGDMMVAKETTLGNLRVTDCLLRKLSAKYPVYYANGNHEQRLREEPETYKNVYQEFCQILKECRVTHLENRAVMFGEDIRISGLEIDKKYYKKFHVPQMTPEDIAGNIGTASEDVFEILLAHSPLFFKTYVDWGADLILSGHFHGGTIRLPVLGGLMTPQYQFFLPWCAGRFEKEKQVMLVSRGLGTHSINIRLNNKPQLIVVRLKRETTF